MVSAAPVVDPAASTVTATVTSTVTAAPAETWSLSPSLALSTVGVMFIIVWILGGLCGWYWLRCPHGTHCSHCAANRPIGDAVEKPADRWNAGVFKKLYPVAPAPAPADAPLAEDLAASLAEAFAAPLAEAVAAMIKIAEAVAKANNAANTPSSTTAVPTASGSASARDSSSGQRQTQSSLAKQKK